MGKKSLSFGQRIITAPTSKINGDIADDRPICGNTIVTQGSIVFTKNHIFDPMQAILNSLMLTNPIGKGSSLWN